MSAAGLAWASSCWPASVKLTLRVVRDRSGAPTRCSSVLMLWLTADGVTPSSLAAERNPFCSATAKNVAVDPQTGAVWTTYTDGKSSFAKSWTGAK